MARYFAAALLAAALGVAAAAGSCSGGVCVEVQAEDASAVGVELLQRSQRRKEEKQFPDLGGIIDAAGDALSNVTDSVTDAVTDQVNSIVNNVTDQVNSVVNNVTDAVSKQVSSVTSAAAMTVASALNDTLLALGAETDKLFTSCDTVRTNILEKMSKTKADVDARLDVLEEQVNSAVEKVLPLWDNITATVVTCSAVATTVLTSVGQEEIAEKLNASLSVALEQANSVADSLQNVTAIMDSFQNVTEEVLSQGLAQIKDALQLGLQKANTFSTSMSSAFGELTDEAAAKIGEAIPGVNATAIDEAFDSVDATVRQVADDLVDGPRQLVNGLSEAVGMVEETLPGEKGAGHRAASCFGLALLGGLLAAAA